MSSLTRAFCNNKKLNQVLKNTRELVSATSQIIAYSLVFSHLSFIPYVHAGPTGGNVVGGSGTINHSGLTTNINQLTSAMAIDWNSYNVNANEIVNYIQPNASSISLNRILSNSASQIHGQINANGQVVLVNTNGIFFSPTASVNVGGLIASGLNIDPVDFMNGEYVFSSIDSDSGAIINSGILNASLGGSISLLGKQVTNNGLISANLGAVNLAAGKEAVLTFDNQGLMGVKITREILQDELGVDPAVLNNGEITAEGGRVLLTASQSQDVFSQAVNSNGIEQATSVVVNEDGSFTLGAGADVVNTGAVDVSTADGNAGKVVMLGENVTSSGNVKADSINENGGEIELHATDTTLLTGNSTTTARSENNGQGGQVKVLGDKVGLFDQSTVDVSGETGGGEVLIGGDRQGQNKLIRNAAFIYLDENSQVISDALETGNGGKVITFANDTARIYGSLSARGGLYAGNGGFIETSGLKNFQITQTPDISSSLGLAGEWLIDPNDISIVSGNPNTNINDGTPITATTAFLTSDDGAQLGVDLITDALKFSGSSATVTITTGSNGADSEFGTITFETDLNYNGIGTGDTLTLNAAHSIDTNGKNISDVATGTPDSLNIIFNANTDSSTPNGETTGGDVIITNSRIYTHGGNFTASGDNFTLTRTDADRNIQTSGGLVLINNTGDVSIGAEIFTSNGTFTATSLTSFDNSFATGDIDTGSGSIAITAKGANVFGVGIDLGHIKTSTTFNATADAGTIIQNAAATEQLEITGVTTLSSSSDITLNNTSNAFSNVITTTARDLTLVDKDAIELGATNITRNLAVTASGSNNDITQSDALVITGTSEFTAASDNVWLEDTNNEFTGAVSANGTVDSFRIRNKKDLVIGNITVSDNSGAAIRLRADGANSDITQLASTRIDMNNGGYADLIATGDTITLANDTNDFYSVRLNALDVVLHETGIIRLSTTDISNNLTIEAGINSADKTDAIQDIGTTSTISVAGITSLKARNTTTTTNAVNIVLDSTNANYATVKIVNADDVEIIDSTNGIAIEGAIRESLTLTANGTVTNGDVITNSGALTVASASTATAVTVRSGQSIDLSNPGNSFTSDLTFATSNGGNIANISIADITDLTLQDGLDISGNLTASANNITFNDTTVGTALSATATNATGLINQTSGKFIKVTDTSTLVANSTAGTITLDNTVNDFTGSVLLTSQTATIRDANSITLGASTLGGGGLAVTTENGIIDQVGVLDITGLAKFKSTNGHINLTGNNIFKGDVDVVTTGTDVTSTAVEITSANEINIVNADVGIANSDFIVNATTINLNGNVKTTGGAATFNGPSILQSLVGSGTLTTNTIITGTGAINFNGTIQGSNAREQSLAITAGNVNFGNAQIGSEVDGTIGNLVSLGELTITSTGDVVVNATAGNDTITARSLNVTQSNSFKSGDIDTSGSSIDAITTTTAQVILNSTTNIETGAISTFGADVTGESAGLAGGDVTLAANNILTGKIDTHGSNASNVALTTANVGGNAGSISITASELTGPTVIPTIKLVDDIDATNGDDINAAGVLIDKGTKTAGLALVSNSSGSVIVEYLNAFTSLLNVTGSSGIDTLKAANIANTWDITGDDTGDLNTQLHFIDFENLIGNTDTDKFTFKTNLSVVHGLIDGGTGLDEVLFDTASAGITVQLDGLIDQVANNILDIKSIEKITADVSNSANNVLLGTGADSNWFINGTGSGFVGNSSLLFDDTVPAEGVTVFSNFNKLTGGTAADKFTILSNTVNGMTINGGISASQNEYDTLIGPDITTGTKWTVTKDNGGTLENKVPLTLMVSFDDMENITAGTGVDSFAFNRNTALGIDYNVDGVADGGLGTDDIDYSAHEQVIYNMANVTAGRINFEKVTGNGIDSTLIGASTNIDAFIWDIEGVNSGFVNKGDTDELEFSGFNNLTGATGNDTFNIHDLTNIEATRGNITGLIDGGTAGTNVLNIYTPANLTPPGLGVAVTVKLEGVAGASANANTYLDVINIGQISANADPSFINEIIAGDSGTNTWDVDGDRTGTINGIRFNNFATLTGADNQIDNFSVTTNSLPVLMTFNGGVSADSSEFDSLTGANIASQWLITDLDIGTVTDALVTGAFSISFNGIESLTGGNSSDSFELKIGTTTGALSSTINGGLGNDSLKGASTGTNTNNWFVSALNEGSVEGVDTSTSNGNYDFTGIENLIGNSGIDKFVLNGGTLEGTIDGGTGSAIDSLKGDNVQNTWEITGANQGNATGLNTAGNEAFGFTDIESLIGNDDTDDFDINGGSISDSIDGGTGTGINDSLTGDDVVRNNWQISGTDQGTLNGIAFSNIEKITGGALNDTFQFTATSSLGITIDGAGEERVLINGTLVLVEDGDVVDMSALPTTTTLEVELGVTFLDVEKIIANGNATLTGEKNLENDWLIYNLADPDVNFPDVKVKDQGTVTDSDGNTVTFVGFNNIFGGDLVDRFAILDNGGITGTINGGGSDDTLDLRAQSVVDSTVGDAIGSNIKSVEVIQGNDTKSILRVDNSGSTWLITGNNSGTVTTGNGDSTLFTGFNILQGGTGNDDFTVQTGGSIGDQTQEDLVSRINGDDGNDTLTVNLSGTATQIVTLFDGDGTTSKDDLLTFSSVSNGGVNDVLINSVSAGYDIASYTTSYSNQNISHNYSNSSGLFASAVSYIRVNGTVKDHVTADNLVINGSGNTNTLSLTFSSSGAGGFTLENGATVGSGAISRFVSYQNKGGLSSRNLGEVSRVELFGDLNFGQTGLIDLSAATVNLLNTGFVITGNKLRLDSVEDINTSNTASRLMLNVAELELNNVTTDLFIQENDGLGLQQIGTTAVLDILSTTGNITDLADLTSSGTLSLTTDTGDITLDNANLLSGNISLFTDIGRTAKLINTSATTLDTVSVGNLEITSSGILSDIGTVTVAQTTILNGNTSPVVLDNGNNDFNVVEITTGSSVEIADQNNIIFGDVDLGNGAFKVTANGVSQLANTAIKQTTSGVAGDVIINAGAGIINLSNINNEFIGNVHLQNSGNSNVSISDISKIIFDNSVIGWGDFTVNATGIEQRAGTSVVQASSTGSPTGTAGNVVLNAGAGAIDLNEAANDFSGVVFLNNTGENNVAIKDANKITLGESTIGGDLSVTAIGDNMPGNERALGDFESGDIEQDNSGAGITVEGASTFRVSDSRSIILDNPENNFNSIAFELTGSTGILDSVILTNNSALDLGNIVLGGHLGLLANGEITNNTGIIQVAGTTWIEASDAGVFNQDPLLSGAATYYDVQLTNMSNDLNDIVINAANNVDIVTLNNINFGDSADLQFAGEPLRDITTIYGNLTVTSTGSIGNIAGMTLNVTGDAQFNAASGSVILDEVVNLNSVAFNAQDVALIEQDTINLGASSISNTASFTALAGNISNNGDIEILGNALFSASDNSDVLLSNILTGNRLQGDLSFVPASGSLNSVNIENTSATSLESVNSINLAVNSQGAISDTETATLRVDSVNLTAGNQDIILDGENNDFNNLTVVSASELQVTDINSLVIEGVNASALTTVVSENNLTVDGAINAGLGVNLTANDGFVLLENTVHTNTGDIGISGNQITQNALIDGGTNISLISASDINQNADIDGNGSGEISLIANNGGITMAADTLSSNNSIAYTTINAGNNASAILANLTANDSIDINVADSLTQTGDFTSATGNINIVASSYVMDTDTITNANAGSVTAEIEGLVDVQSITAGGDLSLTSNTQSVQLNEALVSTQGGVNVSAAQTVTAVDITSETGINLSSTNGSISQNGNFTSEQGVIELNSGQGINMAANTSTSSTLGDIQYNAVNDVIVTSLTANGVAGINTSAGEIIDANEDALNFIATTLSLRAANGIGSTERLESQVSIMDVENSTSGKVDIIQTGEVELVALKNTGSDGDVTLFTDMDINFNPGSVIANRENGELFMTTQTGSFLGLGEGTLTNPDITAQNAVFFGRAGTFGTIERPLTLDVPGSVLIDTKTSFFPRFVPPGPATLDTRGIDFTLIGAISAVAGEQLVEIESLGDIDPAIFTELQNYNQEDVAIRMPRDQLFEDELEEYDRQ